MDNCDDSLRSDPLMVEVVSTTIVVRDNALDSRQTKMMRVEKKFIKFPKSWELILLVRKHDSAIVLFLFTMRICVLV